MSDVRVRKVNALIQREIGEMLLKDIDLDVDGLVTVKHVKTSDDLKYADIWVSVLPDNKSDEVLALLSMHVGHIQRLLNKTLVMKYVPYIRFKIDSSEGKAEKIYRLIKKSTNDDVTKKRNTIRS